jgi:hypothetical protein
MASTEVSIMVSVLSGLGWLISSRPEPVGDENLAWHQARVLGKATIAWLCVTHSPDRASGGSPAQRTWFYGPLTFRRPDSQPGGHIPVGIAAR